MTQSRLQQPRSQQRQRTRVLAAAMVLVGAAVSGCSSHQMIDNMPSAIGGLPEGAPQRPVDPPAYPAVHNMPPPRRDTPLSEAERKRLKDDLIATRERLAKRKAKPESTSSTSGGSDRNP
jgi:hypothetical protein